MPWMGIQDLWTFVAAVLVFLALPGPGTFTLLTATGRGGVRGGYTALFGLLLGDQILMWLAVAGVATLLKANPLVFHAVQYLGAGYLVWIGIGLLRQPRAPGEEGGIRLTPGHYFRQAVLINLLNPKAIIFYMAFLPLFIDPARHQGVVTFATMGLIIFGMGLAYCSVLIGVGNLLRRRILQHPRVGLWLRRVAGVFLVGFGVRLGVSG
ncbi:threonine/homoserine/homoserine lactone efflux protein [Stenotrophomonas rhizophila]|uniref:Threonine/homoserine/homoserine lactone efflux protein n=1 Tax=Stenotrophomonas rhizophila TaxID=216778 RepID=A0A498C5W1_9GAMM|nr:leucine efflux protein LeuE [Stenotrophomonas rhizophila]RLK48420.1 threonine/homoserine/homoserine lactone efflux protein [Stenotrophomonas rhizophila]